MKPYRLLPDDTLRVTMCECEICTSKETCPNCFYSKVLYDGMMICTHALMRNASIRNEGTEYEVHVSTPACHLFKPK